MTTQEVTEKTGRGVKVELTAERKYKDRMFRMIFNDKKELLSLYNAVSGKHYTNPEELEINTLENAIYMKMKNDLSFMIDARLSLYEHQSTYNPNIPLRDLFYIADLYKIITKDEDIYGSKRINLPTPQFIVFYNGVDEQPEKQVSNLSDAYKVRLEEANLELKVLILNINPGYNRELMENCKTLRDYMEYVHKVRTYAKDMTLEEAVDRAIKECIEEGILVEFLSTNRAEAKNMSIYEYDEEKHIQQERKHAREEGREQEIFRSVFENDYSTERGAEKLNLSKELFEEKYQKWMEEKNKEMKR
ncbi:MAG: hypothetical protein PHY47_23860 [Lachnospiraceae bacterium]|nr:hypothetical protein [Lachnospiraceae bacterium]